MSTDKAKGMAEQVAGKAKEAEGKLTGDKVRESQGKVENFLGKARQKVDDLKEDLEEKFDKKE